MFLVNNFFFNNFFSLQEINLTIKNGVHPFIPIDNFVANDTLLGNEHAPFLILSGPNMGGKSTLMRQVAIITIMAQLVNKYYVNVNTVCILW